jgi:hypothetical protein
MNGNESVILYGDITTYPKSGVGIQENFLAQGVLYKYIASQDGLTNKISYICHLLSRDNAFCSSRISASSFSRLKEDDGVPRLSKSLYNDCKYSCSTSTTTP